MPTRPMTSRSFTRALALAFNEWLLMLMLFVNSIFSYMITKFADYTDLHSPCLMCSRLDHILSKKSHWDMICSKHKSEISSLVYCHAHGKLVDVRGMCETCLFSFATTNKSNAETYRLLVGKLGEQHSCNSSKSDTPRYCKCCNQLWLPQTTTTQEAKPEIVSKIGSLGSVRTGKQSTTPKKSVSFNNLPHVGYSELKFHSDTESEALFSEDEGVLRKFQTVDLDTPPPVIKLPWDLATDKLLNLDFTLQPQNELHSRDIDLTTSSLVAELIPMDETSKKVVKEEESDLFLTSRAIEQEDHADASLVEETELISLSDADETPKVFLNETEVISELMCLKDITTTLDATETPQDVLKGTPLDEVLESATTNVSLVEEAELICFKDVTTTPEATGTSEDVLKRVEVMSLDDVPQPVTVDETVIDMSKETPLQVSLVEEAELICLNDVAAETNEDVLKEVELMSLHDLSLEEVLESSTANETVVEMSNEIPPNASIVDEAELICLIDVAADTPQDVLKEVEVLSLHDALEPVTESNTVVEMSKESCPTTSLMDEVELICLKDITTTSEATEAMSLHDEVLESSTRDETFVEISKEKDTNQELAPQAVLESDSSSFNSMSVRAETNQHSGELLDLADAYNIIVTNERKRESNGGGGGLIDEWMKKDTSRVSEDLKALLTQISASRGIEFLSPRDISPKISINSSDQDTKNLDYDMQMLLQRRMLERNESNLSLEGVSVSEIEGESESDRLKRQVDHDRKLLAGLYKELEEERNASAIATNQAMAMITRLQEEKALFQMEALQNLRMMEEQSEYDMEAIQKLNDLLVEREKLIQDLEAEIEYFRDQTPQKKDTLDVQEKVLDGLEEEKSYITSCLEKIENRLNGEAHTDDLKTEDSVLVTEESVTELHERVERLKGDLYFLENVTNSLGHGNEGVEFVKEIASHLRTLRNLSMKKQDQIDG